MPDTLSVILWDERRSNATCELYDSCSDDIPALLALIDEGLSFSPYARQTLGFLLYCILSSKDLNTYVTTPIISIRDVRTYLDERRCTATLD